MAITITCPRCGHQFSTEARTNTRCRQCRTVVNIGRSASASRPLYARSEGNDLDADPPTLVGPAAGALALVGAGSWALWQGWTTKLPKDDSEPGRGRWLWYAAGAALIAFGVWVFVRS